MQTVFKKISFFTVPVIIIFTIAALIAFASVPNAIEIKQYRLYINNNAAYLQLLFTLLALIFIILFIYMSGNEIKLLSDSIKITAGNDVPPKFIHYKNIVSVRLSRSKSLAKTSSGNASYYQTFCVVEIHLDNEDIIQVSDMDIDDIEQFSKNLKALIDIHNQTKP